ncbi:hypothetical protein PTSG_07129 [Salpingoeca rosetta]|uniref:Uncharacterized protein n=1 Tax=Salpingoeca rosetta (strain ATCC 50818 / BSB-021) TaxID=946362 RepID=F2UE51_SALR5|nr:uncharacterized protein PTSG_07129 [Salpingoeca rosetta]EGD74901.1 hypothetical protein PTSG_07129 [Salpingoeca rosetta]|eukprot:XP_004992546.1 hypothetical protein PTSG_07129 [Salpingoeca rosetta]
MSSGFVYDYMAHYRAITAKLKKKFLRRPNTAEVRDSYKDLCVQLTKECNHPYAAFVCLAQARCEEALENKLGEAETLTRAGQYFFKSEADKAMTSRDSFEEDLMDALYCFDAAIDMYLREGKKALAAALCVETSRSLALLGKEEESIPYALKAADLESESPLAAIAALTRASQYQINLLRFEAALDSLFRVVDVVLATCHVRNDDRTCSTVPVDCFLRAARVCPSGVYRATIADAEVQCLLLFYLIHPDQRGRFAALQLLAQRYGSVEHCPHVAHLGQTLVFLLRTLVMLLESNGDPQALVDLQGELWPLLSATQNQLLHHILRLLIVSALVACASAALCDKPEVSSTYAATGVDTQYKQTSFLAQFTVSCDGEKFQDELVAQIGNEFYPVSSDDEGNYQVSWYVPHRVAVSGGETVKIFDQDSISRAQKALREGGSTDGLEAFTVSSSFSSPIDVQLPIAPQFLAMAAFGYAAVVLFMKTRNVQ